MCNYYFRPENYRPNCLFSFIVFFFFHPKALIPPCSLENSFNAHSNHFLNTSKYKSNLIEQWRCCYREMSSGLYFGFCMVKYALALFPPFQALPESVASGEKSRSTVKSTTFYIKRDFQNIYVGIGDVLKNWCIGFPRISVILWDKFLFLLFLCMLQS